MSYAIARQQVREDIERAAAFVAAKRDTALEAPGLNSRQRRHIERLFTGDPLGVHLSLARLDVAAASGLAMAGAMLDHWTPRRRDPDFRYWLGTFAWDAGMRPLGAYLEPEVAAAMMLKVYKELAAYGFHAVICLEVDLLLRSAEDAVPWLLYHIHAACWRYDNPVRPRLLARSIMAGGRYPNDLGAPGVRFTTNRRPKEPPRLLQGEEIRLRGRAPPTAASVAGLAAYMLKNPVCLKVLKPRRDDPTRNRLDTDQTKFSASLVCALAEARSRLSLLATVKGLGEGSGVRTAWKHGCFERLGLR